MNALEANNISHAYPPTKRQSEGRKALFGVSFSIPGPGIFSVLGPNGGGKTTLFKIFSGLLSPQTGEARIFGDLVSSRSASTRKKVGVVFQKPSLDKKLTVEENLRYQGQLFGLSSADIQDRSRKALTLFDVLDRSDDLVENLSGGLQRRVEIAKSLLHDPKVLILDEPSAGLDPSARRALRENFQTLKKNGTTVFLTTHILEEAEESDAVFILHQGRLRAQGSPSELKSKIGGEILALKSKDPEALNQKIKDKFKEEGVIVGAHVRIEKKEAHKAIPQYVEAFPGVIEEASVSKPTLEDVFIDVTGVEFENGKGPGEKA